MSRVQTLPVTEAEDDIRLDRWFRRRFPGLSHGRLEKLLRTGQVRVDGARVKAAHRLAIGQQIRVPPLPESAVVEPKPRAKAEVRDKDVSMLRDAVIYQDRDILAINKPQGLAVQGGSKTHRHVDGLLDHLKFGSNERPKLVHRLDRDTSGVLILARHSKAATWLSRAFQQKNMEKIYWAITVGVPSPPKGTIDLRLQKGRVNDLERMLADEGSGQQARSDFVVISKALRQVAWLALRPQTGRTHQLRAHCAAIGTPILGDGKYGGAEARIEITGAARGLHLHAREITIPRPGQSKLQIIAPVSTGFAQTMEVFGFEEIEASGDLFAELKQIG